MHEIFTVLNDIILPLAGCFWAATIAHDRGGNFIAWALVGLTWPIPGVLLVSLVGRRCYQCRRRMHDEAAECPWCSALVPERQVVGQEEERADRDSDAPFDREEAIRF